MYSLEALWLQQSLGTTIFCVGERNSAVGLVCKRALKKSLQDFFSASLFMVHIRGNCYFAMNFFPFCIYTDPGWRRVARWPMRS